MTTIVRRASRFGPSRVMGDAEVEAFLEQGWWGVLSTAAGGVPYGVPVVYGFDGDCFWIVAREGRKVRNVRQNPTVCLSVSRVAADGAGWASVVVTGTACLVKGHRPRLVALRALRRQCGHLGPVRSRDAAGMAGAKVIRIDPEEITGRTLDPIGRGTDETA